MLGVVPTRRLLVAVTMVILIVGAAYYPLLGNSQDKASPPSRDSYSVGTTENGSQFTATHTLGLPLLVDADGRPLWESLILMPLKGYTYRYTLRSAGFMSFSKMGYGVACPGIFRAYYEVDYEWNVKFVSSYFPSKEDSTKFNDPHVIIEEFEKKASSKRLTHKGEHSILVLSKDEEGWPLNTHYRLKALYEGDALRWVSFNTTHSLNYDPRNSSVLVDYVDTYETYELEGTRCWQVLIGWLKPLLKWYLRSQLGEIPYPKPWEGEPW